MDVKKYEGILYCVIVIPHLYMIVGCIAGQCSPVVQLFPVEIERGTWREGTRERVCLLYEHISSAQQ